MKVGTLRSGLASAAIVMAGAEAPPATAADISPADAAHIAAIERALATPSVIRGAPAPATSLAERMAVYNVPGVSIAYIRDGKIAWARGYGLKQKGGEPVTPDTLFQAGSISKPVAAMSVLSLVQAGKLDLDADVNRYLRRWKVLADSLTARTPVTLRGLLSHTAGVTVHGFPGYAKGEKIPTLVQVLDGAKPANTPPIRVDTAPGTIWRYSGGGYVITQKLLEDVTGRPFAAFAETAVLRPAGMDASTYAQPLPAARAKAAAVPYRANGAPVEGGAHTYPEMTAAGLWTTPSDLGRFAIEVQKALAGRSKIIAQPLAREMLKPGGLGGWGLGLRIGGAAERPYFEHNGADEGFISEMVAYNDGDGVAIMTNGDGGGRLADEVLRTVALEYGWPDLGPRRITPVAMPAEALDRYVGHYRLGRYLVLDIVREGGGLAAQVDGRPKYEIFPVDGDHWAYRDIEAEIAFAAEQKGMRTGLSLKDGGDNTGVRIADAEAGGLRQALAAKLAAQSQDPATEAAVRRIADELKRGAPDYSRMRPSIADTVLRQLSGITAEINRYGAVASVRFKGVGPAGADIYEVAFDTGTKTEWRILLDADGEVESLGYRDLAP